MNKSILIGRLCADPEVRYTNEGMAIAKVSLAVDRIGKDKGADFIRLVAFDKRAQIFEKYLKKDRRSQSSVTFRPVPTRTRMGRPFIPPMW